MNKQVEKSHYSFLNYMSKSRWSSVWHQLNEVIKLEPANVLEIGPALGLFKKTAGLFGVDVQTLDMDPELQPDYVGSATALPFSDNSYDVVCAFQMLEHIPYQESLSAFNEIVRVSKSHILISLPDSRPARQFKFYIPKIGDFDFILEKPFYKKLNHKFDGEHFWEINKKEYGLEKVIYDLSKTATLERTWRVNDNSYHRFFLFKK